MKNSGKKIFDALVVAVVFMLLFFINVAKFIYKSFHLRSFQRFKVV